MSEWVDIPGFEGLYQINKEGDVLKLPRVFVLNNSQRRATKSKILKQNFREGGYYFVRLHNVDGVRQHFDVHRILAITFLPNPLNKPCVNHLDLDKTNNHLSNLEWVTYAENAIHAVENGARKIKVCENVQKQIVELLAYGETQLNIAKQLNIGVTTVKRFVKKHRTTEEGMLLKFGCSTPLEVITPEKEVYLFENQRVVKNVFPELRNRNTISHVLNGKREHYKNFTFKYSEVPASAF